MGVRTYTGRVRGDYQDENDGNEPVPIVYEQEVNR
jgi:hypothetical protein